MRNSPFRKIITVAALALMAVSVASAQTSAATAITFNGDSITIDGAGATTSGNTALITLEGVYTLSGTLNDGQVVVDSETDGLVTLILDGVTMSSSTSAPLYVKEAGSVEIIIADGTENTLTDALTYVYETAEDDEPNAALFSDDPLTISGTGSLNVTGNANDGITSKDTLVITDAPVITVTASDDGIRGKDSLTIDGGEITLSVGGDGLKSDATITLNAGTVDILESYEGVEAEYITINGGEIRLVSSDDGFNAASQTEATETTTAQSTARNGRGGGFGGEATGAYTLSINGGTVIVNAGGDGLDSNGSITMTGGTVLVYGPTNAGNGAIDYNGTFTLSGGTLAVAGSAGMPQAPSTSSSQYSVMVNFDTVLPAETLITLRDAAGTQLLTLTPVKEFQSIVLSTPQLVAGGTYEVVVGDTVYANFTASQVITQLGEARGMMRR